MFLRLFPTHIYESKVLKKSVSGEEVVYFCSALLSANKCLALGGLLLIASPDSACQNKHMHLIRDWFSGLGKDIKKISPFISQL